MGDFVELGISHRDRLGSLSDAGLNGPRLAAAPPPPDDEEPVADDDEELSLPPVDVEDEEERSLVCWKMIKSGIEFNSSK